LVEEIRNKVIDFEQLCTVTGAGTVCGSCRPEVKAILHNNVKPQTV